jgi:hypothetical protein
MKTKQIFVLYWVNFFIIFSFFSTKSTFSQILPQPGESFDAITDNGIWTWYGEPKAVYYEGKYRRTYMAWGSNINAQYIGYYDHDTKQKAQALLPRHYPASDHNHPSIVVRPDGRVMAFVTGHDGREISQVISRNPEDISVLDTHTVTILDWCCYPNVVFLKNEGTKGRYYLFFRDLDQEPHFRTSDDWGETWGPEKKLYTNNPSGYKPYVKFASNGIDEIHIAIERENRAGSPKPTYFMKYKNGVFYHVDGRKIATIDELPIVNTVLDTLMYPGFFGCGGTVWDIAIDENGYPIVVYDMYKGAYIHIYWYLRWNGSYWYRRPLLNSGGTMGAQNEFAGGITLDHENPNIVYISHQSVKAGTNVFNLADTSMQYWKDSLKTTSYIITDSSFELSKWVTKDGGKTWDTFSITTNSSGKNCRPCVPRGHKEGMNISLIWLNGTYTSMSGSGYSMAVRMYPTNLTVPIIPYSNKSNYCHNSIIQVSNNLFKLNIFDPSKAFLRVYSINGKQIADFSNTLRGMSVGNNIISLDNTYNSWCIFDFYDGMKQHSKTGVILK